MGQQSNSGLLWAEAVISSLVRDGVDTFFVAPGSRSTPLVLAAARHPGATTIVHFDERGAAFAAVGFARGALRAAGVITTSGTAVANLLPAIVEASEDAVPMVVLTADRPAQMRGTGANQTIDQVDIFGGYVRFFADAAPPAEDHLDHAASLVKRALAAATDRDSGPVHLNCMFAKPLQPDYVAPASPEAKQAPREGTMPARDGITEAARRAVRNTSPTSSLDAPLAATLDAPLAATLNVSLKASLKASLMATPNGRAKLVVVAGRMDSAIDAQQALSIAAALDCPLIADIASQVPRDGTWPVVTCPDAILASADFLESSADLVVHVGGRVVSQRVLTWLQRTPPRRYVHIAFDDRPFKLDGVEMIRIAGPVDDVASIVNIECDSGWRERWKSASEIANSLLGEIGGTSDNPASLTERWIATTVWREMPRNWGLLVGNSMPVRDFDGFAWGASGPELVATNRGASGIDGLVATAAGTALGSHSPVLAVIGDQSLLHDLNSLALLARSAQPVVLLVINNGGGGIFSMLPIADHVDVFDSHFFAAHRMSFESAAAQFGIPYSHVEEQSGFYSELERAFRSGRSRMLEVVTSQQANHQDRVQFREALARSLAGAA